MQLNIVIPMAGRGSRFAKDGYKRAKPFIVFDGRMMIEHVLEGLPHHENVVTLVIQKSFRSLYSEELNYLKRLYNPKFAVVNCLTAGAACTALAARKFVDINTPVLFADSDNIFNIKDVCNFLSDAKNRNLEGSLITFSSHSDKFSYVSTNSEGLAIELREKQVISANAVAGAYYFSSYESFQDCAIDMMIYGGISNNEYYMSNVYNYLIAKKSRVGIYSISEDSFNCVGTPAQLDAYLEKIK